MRRSKRANRRSLVLVGLLAAVICVGLLVLRLWENKQLEAERASITDDGYPTQQRFTLEYGGKTYQLREGVECTLVMGLDKYAAEKIDEDDYINDMQSDFLILMIVDEENGTLSALHVNRDSMAEIQRYGLAGKKLNSFVGQLALSHTYGSGGRDSARYACEAVSKYLSGIPIEHFVSLTMDAIPTLNDLVGGVTVYVEDDFSNTDPSIKQGSTMRLQGRQALTFIRARSSMNDPSNIKRMDRQRVYMDGLYKQIKAQLASDANFTLHLADELGDTMQSDLSAGELSELGERWASYDFKGIETVKGEAKLGEKYIEFYADEDALTEQLIRLLMEPVY